MQLPANKGTFLKNVTISWSLWKNRKCRNQGSSQHNLPPEKYACKIYIQKSITICDYCFKYGLNKHMGWNWEEDAFIDENQ